MQMIRFATIVLSRPAPSRLEAPGLVMSNGVSIDPMGVAAPSGSSPGGDLTISWPQDSLKTVVAARAALSGVSFATTDDLIIVPEQERQRAEAALVEYADLLSVSLHCRRTIWSPRPCVAMVPETADEVRAFNSVKGVASPKVAVSRSVIPARELTLEKASGLLVDRLDGLGLLADSLAEEGSLARVNDCFRLFERAFKKGPGECAPLLADFLASGRSEMEFSLQEVQHWLQGIRPLTMHADRRPNYGRPAAVEPFLPRIEYAAYDTLFNKLRWRSAEPDRRPALTLSTGRSRDGTAVLLFQRGGQLIAPWLDPYGIFPADFVSNLNVGPPAEARMPGFTAEAPGQRSTQLLTFKTMFDGE